MTTSPLGLRPAAFISVPPNRAIADDTVMTKISAAGVTEPPNFPLRLFLICNGKMDMPKTLLSREELKDRAFQGIKRCEGCDDVSDVTIYVINDDDAQSNWGIGAIGVGPGSASAAETCGGPR